MAAAGVRGSVTGMRVTIRVLSSILPRPVYSRSRDGRRASADADYASEADRTSRRPAITSRIYRMHYMYSDRCPGGTGATGTVVP